MQVDGIGTFYLTFRFVYSVDELVHEFIYIHDVRERLIITEPIWGGAEFARYIGPEMSDWVYFPSGLDQWEVAVRPGYQIQWWNEYPDWGYCGVGVIFVH
jgi:hypothetical protein